MPKYRVTDPQTGKTLTLTGDSPPTEAELTQIFGATTATPTEAPSPAEGKSLGGFGENVLTSAGNFVGDMARGIGGAVMGAAKLAPRMILDPAGTAQQLGGPAYEAVKQAIPAEGQRLKGRYGSLDAIGNTLYTDPVGVAGDVASIAGLASGAGEAMGATRLARMAGQAEKYTNPLRLVTSPVTAAAGALAPKMEASAVSAYERMLKAPKGQLEDMPRMGSSLQERSKNVASQLLHDPNGQISAAGQRNYADATAALQGKVDALVDANPEARGSTQHLQDALDQGRGKFAKQWAPGGDTSAYDRVAEETMNNPRITKTKRGNVTRTSTDDFGRFADTTAVEPVGREPIPRVTAKGARELTQGTYRTLSDKSYTGELKGAETEAQKASARGGRAILNEAIPAVEPINNQIANRIDLGGIQDNAVFNSGKRDFPGVRDAVAVASGNPGLILGALTTHPSVGYRAARATSQLGGALGRVPGISVEALRAALLARLMGQDGSE